MPNSTLPTGLVTAAHGRHYTVELENKEVRHCFPRGKRSELAVGDKVRVNPIGSEEGHITEVITRQNLLYRSDKMRSKLFAANVDQIFIVVATEPAFSNDLLGRAIIAAHAAQIPLWLILNKTDLADKLATAKQQLNWVYKLGIPVIPLSALSSHSSQEILLPYLKGKVTLLLGQSAMGKSTLLNALVPDAQANTQAHSQALGAGKHTTTTTRLYHLPEHAGAIIDSPGFQSFGLHHLGAQEIESAFTEFHTEKQACRFYNCTHRREPGCQVQERLKAGKIHPVRFHLYEQLLAEHEAKIPY